MRSLVSRAGLGIAVQGLACSEKDPCDEGPPHLTISVSDAVTGEPICDAHVCWEIETGVGDACASLNPSNGCAYALGPTERSQTLVVEREGYVSQRRTVWVVATEECGLLGDTDQDFALEPVP